MNCSDLLLNIRETYKDCDDRLEKNYRKEFEAYSSTKLEQVWSVIEENHNFAKAPELGNIFKYMNMLGVARTKDGGTFYKRCTELVISRDQYGDEEKDADGEIIMIECGCKYSTKSKFCPVCNQERSISNPLMNSYEVVKCNSLPKDLRVLNELCGTCKLYQKNSLVRGSKCSAWNSHDEYKKSNKNCKDCPCYDCCNEKPMNGIQNATMKINKSIKKI